jgi:hypothetical protein
MTLHHVCQKPKSMDCCVAAVAMIANVTYDEVLAQCTLTKRGVKLRRLPGLLRRFTQVKWRYRDGWFCRLETFLSGRDSKISMVPRLAIIRRPWQWNRGHAIVLYGGWVHDPQYPNSFRREKYPRRDWKVMRIYEPRHADGLDASRLRNWLDRNLTLTFSASELSDL